MLGKDPSFPIILTSYAHDLASDFGLETRDLMDSKNYQAVFDTRLRADAKAKAKWLTHEKGGYTATGIGGPITGKGFRIGIIDDPLKNREDADSEVIREKQWKWFRSTFLTREEGNGAIILILTRWHDDDLAGRILKQQEQEGTNEWELIRMTAIAEEDEPNRKKGEALWPWKFPISILNKRKTDLGPYEWSALYQQNPVDSEHAEFKKEWFKSRTFEEVLKLETRKFVTIDPAWAMRDKSDYIGVTINYVDKENTWNLRSFRVKMDSKELVNLMFKLHDEVKPEKFGIEEGAYEMAIKPFMEDEMRKRGKFLTIEPLKHKGHAKNMRIRGMIPRYSSGSIYHIENECGDLEEELVRFPKGTNDDTADSAAYQNQIADKPSPDSKDDEEGIYEEQNFE